MGRLLTTSIVAAVLATAWLVAAAGGKPSSPPSRISLAVPARAAAGERVAASGRVSGAPAGARVRIVGLRGGSWRPLGRAALAGGRYLVQVLVPVGQARLHLRAELVGGGRTLARSPARTVRIGAAGVVPAPPSSPSPVPAATGPPAVVSSPASMIPPQAETEPPDRGGETEPPTEEPEGEPEPPTSPPYTGPMYWGAWIDGGPWDWGAVEAFEKRVGKNVSLLEFSSPFQSCGSSGCENESFPSTPFSKIRAEGAIPFFSWGSQSTPAVVEEPAFQLQDVAAGDYDPYIEEWAEAAAAWGHPFFLRFDWEMNGNWFSWGANANGNLPGSYVAAWRHVHQIFVAKHATNASWVWCPYVDPSGSVHIEDPEAFYPGNDVVDWTCLDGYNFGTLEGRKWHPFEYWFGHTYDRMREIAPSKPILIGETASSEQGGSKAKWIEEMFTLLPTRFPALRGLIWFDSVDGTRDWKLETSTGAEAAFRSGISDPRWLAGSLSNLATSPIPPP